MIGIYHKIFGGMAAADLGVKNDYLDKEASEEYKAAIRTMNARWNKSHLVTTDAILPREPSKLPRTILYPCWWEHICLFQCTYGAVY